MQGISLSVVLPCYNEEANVERVTQAALEVLPTLVDAFEIIIVNDGSGDRTGEIADRLAAAHSAVHVVHNNPNRGYGGALRRGFSAATLEWVFYTDGDGQFDLKDIANLLPLIDHYDIVSGFRIRRTDSLMRRLNAWGWKMLTRWLLGLKVRDVDCAFKIYPRKLFDEIELHSEGALIDAEVLAKATRHGYTIGEVGVNHFPRTAGKQTGARPRVILRAFVELIKLRRAMS